jgi:enoyl-CoA hydratase/carnithine racemase
MSYQTIKYEKRDGICLITLNRPHALNTLSLEMLQELDVATDEVINDDEINVIIYTGAPRPDGRPCFSAGADLKDGASGKLNNILKLDSSGVSSFADLLGAERQPKLATAKLFEKIAWCQKITIAAVDGVCTAGGLELALCCDIILVSETAQISDWHLKSLGWMGGAASQSNLAWRVGVSKAIELCCTGDVIDGKEAYRIGFANRIFSPDKLLDGTYEMAEKIAGMRPAAVKLIKASCRAVQDMDFRSSWHFADAAAAALLLEPDGAEWGPGRWLKGRNA